jgi:hypothetical protein
LTPLPRQGRAILSLALEPPEEGMKSAIVKLLLVMTPLLCLGGCFEKEQPTCAYWVPKLKDPVKGEQALDKMEDFRCREAVPVLAELYEEGLRRKRILRLLTLIRDKEGSAPILKKAVVTRDLGKLASSIIEEWQLAAAKPELLEILTSDILEKNRPDVLLAPSRCEEAVDGSRHRRSESAGPGHQPSRGSAARNTGHR